MENEVCLKFTAARNCLRQNIVIVCKGQIIFINEQWYKRWDKGLEIYLWQSISWLGLYLLFDRLFYNCPLYCYLYAPDKSHTAAGRGRTPCHLVVRNFHKKLLFQRYIMHACQVETPTCIEISEYIWRPLILANKTSSFFSEIKQNFFLCMFCNLRYQHLAFVIWYS